MPHLPYIKLYSDNIDLTAAMTDEQAGKLLKAMLEYANGGDPHPEGDIALVWIMMRKQIDVSAEVYERKVGTMAHNRRKQGATDNNQISTDINMISAQDKTRQDKTRQDRTRQGAMISRAVKDEEFPDGVNDIMNRRTGK